MDLNEKIIECVRKHTCLYEPSDKNYKNAFLKARIWQQIADEFNESSDTIKKKWKSMRDGYIKYRKQIKGTTGSEKKAIHFMWSAQLSFLDSGISPRKTASNVGTEGSQTQTSAKDTLPLSTTLTTSSTPESALNQLSTLLSSKPNQQLEPTTTPCRAKKRIAEPDEPDVDDMIKNYIKTKTDNRSHNYDSVDYLFLSYAQTFKKLSLRKQAILKVQLAKLFSEAELSEIVSTENYSPAYSVLSSVPENMNLDTNTTTVTLNSPAFSVSSSVPENMNSDTNTTTVTLYNDTNEEELSNNLPQDLSNTNVFSFEYSTIN